MNNELACLTVICVCVGLRLVIGFAAHVANDTKVHGSPKIVENIMVAFLALIGIAFWMVLGWWACKVFGVTV